MSEGRRGPRAAFVPRGEGGRQATGKAAVGRGPRPGAAAPDWPPASLRGGAASRGRARACVCGVAMSGGSWTACACVCVSPSGGVKRWQRRARRGRSWGPSGAGVSGDGFPVTLGGVAAGADPGSRGWQGVRVTGWRPRGALRSRGRAASCSGGETGVFLPHCHGAGSSRGGSPSLSAALLLCVSCVCASASSFGVFISSSSFPGSCTD